MKFSTRAKRLIEKHTEARAYNGDHYPLCWNVKIYNATTEFDDVFKEMCSRSDFGFINQADALLQIPKFEQFREEWGNGEEWDALILEDMRTTFVGPNMYDTMRCCAPKVYKRFGLPEDYDEMWDVEYSFQGRGGGWLSLDTFEGVQTAHMEEEIWGRDDDSAEPTRTCWYQKLCCQIVSTTWMVNARYKEYLYQAAFQMRQLLEDYYGLA